jgi:CheY-like chemotaxis protein
MPGFVLIVEDDEDLLFLYKSALGSLAPNIDFARTAGELLRKLNQPDYVPDLVILDIEMPDAQNFRAIEIMRREPRFAETKIIVITANDAYRERLAGVVDAFLLKPLAITEVIKMAGAWLA